jgi:hypothetical protein
MKQFGFIHKIKKIVMGFTANHIEGDSNKVSPSTLVNENDILNKQEIEILLSMIKRTTFLGEDIEPLYILVSKLQNQYLKIKI